MEEAREKPWNFHTCKSCPYRSKSTFIMCKHVRLHRKRPKTETFLCDSKTPEMFECEFCDFETDLNVNLCEHFRVSHEEKKPNDELESIVMCFQCIHCDFKSHSLLVLTKHCDDCSLQHRDNLNRQILVRGNTGCENLREGGPAQSTPRSSSKVVAQNKRLDTQLVALNEQNCVTRRYTTRQAGQVSRRNKHHIISSENVKLKRHCCYFCSKLVTTIGRHLKTHRNEAEICRILALPSSDRRIEFRKLRLQGDKTYNDKVQPNKRITVRQSLRPIFENIECPLCNALISRACFCRHEQKCSRRPALPPGYRRRGLLHGTIKSSSAASSLESSSTVTVCQKEKQDSDSMKPRQGKKEHLKTPGKKRCRRHCCYFCSELVTCMGRHLQTIHKDEPEMEQIMTLPSSDKQKELKKLRLQGDKIYNEVVKPSERIYVRKPYLQSVSQSVECSYCNALIAKKNIRKHDRKCSGMLEDRRRRKHTLQSIVLGSKTQLEELLNRMRNDEITRIVKIDETIILLGLYYLGQFDTTKYYFKNLIRNRLRRCARLLLRVKELDSTIDDLRDCVSPEKYAVLVEAIKDICNFDGTKFQFATLALEFESLLTFICEVLHVEYLKKNILFSDTQIEALNSFMNLLKTEFKIDVRKWIVNKRTQNKIQESLEVVEI